VSFELQCAKHHLGLVAKIIAKTQFSLLEDIWSRGRMLLWNGLCFWYTRLYIFVSREETSERIGYGLSTIKPLNCHWTIAFPPVVGLSDRSTAPYHCVTGPVDASRTCLNWRFRRVFVFAWRDCTRLSDSVVMGISWNSGSSVNHWNPVNPVQQCTRQLKYSC